MIFNRGCAEPQQAGLARMETPLFGDEMPSRIVAANRNYDGGLFGG